jgi:Rrf2 family protein
MMSQTTEYALRAIVHLGMNLGTPQTTIEISKAINAPVGYLAKVLNSLARMRLVESQRGVHGGFVLAQDPSAMTIYDVVQAVDPIVRITSCPLDIHGHSTSLCLLHATLDESLSHAEHLFRSTRISDLLRPPPEKARTDGSCTFPHGSP